MDEISKNVMGSGPKIDSLEKKSMRDAVRSKFDVISSRVTKRAREDKETFNRFQEEIFDFFSSLEKEYPNVRKYLITHILFGSGPTIDGNSVYDDFTGKHSVKKFVDDLEKKYP